MRSKGQQGVVVGMLLLRRWLKEGPSVEVSMRTWESQQWRWVANSPQGSCELLPLLIFRGTKTARPWPAQARRWSAVYDAVGGVKCVPVRSEIETIVARIAQ